MAALKCLGYKYQTFLTETYCVCGYQYSNYSIKCLKRSSILQKMSVNHTKCNKNTTESINFCLTPWLSELTVLWIVLTRSSLLTVSWCLWKNRISISCCKHVVVSFRCRNLSGMMQLPQEGNFHYWVLLDKWCEFIPSCGISGRVFE